MVLDIGIMPAGTGRGRLGSDGARDRPAPRALRHPGSIVPWDKYRELFESGGVGSQIAGLRDMHPTDLAGVVESLPGRAVASLLTRCRTKS